MEIEVKGKGNRIPFYLMTLCNLTLKGFPGG